MSHRTNDPVSPIHKGEKKKGSGIYLKGTTKLGNVDPCLDPSWVV